MSDFFGIDFDADRNDYAEEGFIVEVQYELSKLLKAKGISRSAFAKSMGVSPAYVSQMLGDEGANLTCRTIAKAYIALGEEPTIRTKSSLAGVALADSQGTAACEASADDDWSLSKRRGRAEWRGRETSQPGVSPSNDDGWGVVVPFFRKAA